VPDGVRPWVAATVAGGLSCVAGATAAVLRGLPESSWQNPGRHQERGELSLQQLVEGATKHAEHHVQQIRELRK
jgi:hypothetical protein